MRIFIDRTTGTWGLASDLVIAEVKDSTVEAMESMSDSQLITLATGLERISSPDLHTESE